MNEEMDTLLKNKTWELVSNVPNDRKPIGCKWVFKIQNDSNGQTKFKARLVAQGFSHKLGDEYDHVFPPVARQRTVQVLLIIAATRKMKVQHVDAKTALEILKRKFT